MKPFQPPPGVITEISPNDLMYGGNVEPGPPEDEQRGHYFWLGRSAIRCIRAALRAAIRQEDQVKSILDLPCGHGRVMRALKASFPNAALTACDIDRDGVDFCAEVFDATPVYGSKDLSELDFGQRFDLIWCGSLVTHLDLATGWSDFLALFERSLAAKGLLVFTVNGRVAAEMMRDGTYDHDLNAGQIAEILKAFDAEGAGYVDYVRHNDYGLSIAAPSRVAALIEERTGLRLVNYTEAGWGAHQDVVACVRPAL